MAMSAKGKNVLVLGVGNILQKDDGVGVHVINFLMESNMNLPDHVELMDGGTAGYDLMSAMKDRDKVIIVDALKVDDKPGSVYRFFPDYLVPENVSFSLHDIGMKKVIDALAILGSKPNIEIIGIVPEDIKTVTIGLSDSVQKSIPRVIEEIFDAIIQ